MKGLPVSARPNLLVLLACALICVATAWVVFFRESKPPPFMALHGPYRRPLPVRDRIAHWLPATQAWSWVPHLEDVLLGPRKPININAEIIALSDSPNGTLPSSLALGSPGFTATDGLQVWSLDDREVRTLRDCLKRAPGADFVSRPRISTADGVECSMFVGQSIILNGSTNDVGVKAGFFPRVHKRSTDLFSVISFSELVTNQTGLLHGLNAAGVVSIQTNLAFAARLQIPKGTGLFLLSQNPAGQARKRFGMLIEPPQP